MNDITEFNVSADHGSLIPPESYTSNSNTFLKTTFIHFKGLTLYGVRLYLLLIIIYSKNEKLIISIFQSNGLPNNANYHSAWKMFLLSFSGSANIISRTLFSYTTS